jgi:tetratricopeptide (TPR) repeat protein
MQQKSSDVKVAGRISQEDLAALLSGKLPLGQFLGLSGRVLDQIAEIGHRMLATGRLAQARQIYEGLVAVQPFDSLYYCHLGAVYQRLNEPEMALEAYSRALQSDLRNVDALAGRGEIYLQCGQRQEAVRDLSEAIRLDPQAKRASSARARALIEAVRKAGN